MYLDCGRETSCRVASTSWFVDFGRNRQRYFFLAATTKARVTSDA
jgi:hypothetical protein